MGSTLNLIFSTPQQNIRVQNLTGTPTISDTGPTWQPGHHSAHTTQITSSKLLIGTMFNAVNLFSNVDWKWVPFLMKEETRSTRLLQYLTNSGVKSIRCPQPCSHSVHCKCVSVICIEQMTSPQRNYIWVFELMVWIFHGEMHEISVVPFDWHLDTLLYWLAKIARTVFSANRAKVTCRSLVRPSNQKYTGPH